MTQNDLFAALWEEAIEQARIRALEEGDVDIDKDYALIEQWTQENFQHYCQLEGLDAKESGY